jgi:hypothetical protein
LAFALAGAVHAASYTSPALIHDFSGASSATAAPDGDKNWQVFTEQTGWQRFGTSSNNPLPAFLQTIDPNFAAKYQVDSLQVSITQKWGTSATTDWTLDVGDGSHANGPVISFSDLSGPAVSVNSFTILPNTPVFQTALAGANGSFMFRLRETTSGSTDTLNLYNVKAYVNYADLPAPVPEPAEWAMLMAGLVVVGFIAKRRHKDFA